MALRLMLRGWDVRWATYSRGGFKEGVSLSVDDELNRWQKYAYGCNECVFLYPFLKPANGHAGYCSTQSRIGGREVLSIRRFIDSYGVLHRCITNCPC